ncbi:uncharacterized protein LOC21410240 isoform X2 [Morus notabilis]|uniref:uncharacterized protein LOC21410240 isoform X2 n=1 Tax=Morus notabilis TaxID=981085 RepID=UPI000CED3B0F|nr:uncharacterized protein LOC21410240 isoform X2 [Morus notabilis]
MANKLSAASDSEAATANRTVFIDTSLNTHLAMVLADSYSVSDFKRKIEKEHTLCFTNIGNIVVHALKVKRKGHLYHLSDSMFVKDAFDGASKNWFLSVDASIVEEKRDEKRLVHNPDSHNLLTCYGLLCNASANGVDLSLDGSPDQGTSDPNNATSPQKHVERKSDVSNHGILGKCDKSGEEASQSDHAAKRKRKFDDEVRNEHLQGDNIDTVKDISKREIISQHALGDEEKSKNAALDDLPFIPVNDDHPVMNNSSIEMKKRRKKSKSRLGQVAAVDPSAGRDFLEESYMITTGIDQKGSGGEPNTKSFTGQGENGIKHSDTIQETGEHVPSAEVHEADAHEEDATSLATKMGNSKDHYPVEMESNPPLVMEKHVDLPIDIGVSGQENIVNNQAERAEEEGALSKKKDSLEIRSKKHYDLATDIGVSGQENIGSGQAERAKEQGALSKKKGSRKTQSKRHGDLPLDIGVSGQENIRSDQAERTEVQEVLTKNKRSRKTQLKKDDNLPMGTGVSGQENIISDQAVRAEEQGAFSKNKGLQKTRSKRNDIEVGVSRQENTVSDQAERAEEQGGLSKRKDDNLPMDIEVSGQENIISYQAERAEEQGAFSKNKGSQKPWSKENDNRPIEVGVSGQENIVSDQAERAEEQGALSKRKETLKTQSKKHDNLSLNIGVSGQEKVRSGQAEIAEEQGTLTNRENSLKMQPKKRDSRRQEETEVETKDVNAAADLLDENGTVEPMNSRKKRKGSKKTKDLIAKVVTSLGREDVEGSETNISVKPFEPLGDKARNEETNLSQTNRKEELRSNAESTFLAKENGDVTGTEVNTVQQTSGYQAENVEEQVGKKPKRKPKSSVKNPPVLQSEAGSVVHQISPAPVDKTLVVGSSKSKDKGKLKKRAVEDRLNEEKMESESRGVEKELVPTQPAQSNSAVAKSTKVQSNSIDPKYKENAGEADPSDGANKDIEISGAGSEKPLPDTSSGGLVDKKTGANKDAKTPKSKTNIENPDTYSDKISSAFQSSQKANRKQGIEKKAPAGKSSTTPLQSLSKDNPDESAVQPTEKLQKASKTEAKASPTDVSGKLNSTRKETKMQHAVGVSGTNIQSEKNTGLASVSNSPMESSRNIISKDVGSNKHQPGMHSYRAANIKAAVKGDGKIVNSLEPTKKLIATPGTIFRDDDSGESSEDEGGTDDSDTSTRTPSDYSQSSDYSDGESNSNFNSPERALQVRGT